MPNVVPFEEPWLTYVQIASAPVLSLGLRYEMQSDANRGQVNGASLDLGISESAIRILRNTWRFFLVIHGQILRLSVGSKKQWLCNHLAKSKVSLRLAK